MLFLLIKLNQSFQITVYAAHMAIRVEKYVKWNKGVGHDEIQEFKQQTGDAKNQAIEFSLNFVYVLQIEFWVSVRLSIWRDIFSKLETPAIMHLPLPCRYLDTATSNLYYVGWLH